MNVGVLIKIRILGRRGGRRGGNVVDFLGGDVFIIGLGMRVGFLFCVGGRGGGRGRRGCRF